MVRWGGSSAALGRSRRRGDAVLIRMIADLALRDAPENAGSALDTHFYVGTVHRFPATWIVVGLFYPPKVASRLF